MGLIPHILKVLSFSTTFNLMIKHLLFDCTFHIFYLTHAQKTEAKTVCLRTEDKRVIREEKAEVLLVPKAKATHLST